MCYGTISSIPFFNSILDFVPSTEMEISYFHRSNWNWHFFFLYYFILNVCISLSLFPIADTNCTYTFHATPNEQVTIVFDHFKVKADNANVTTGGAYGYVTQFHLCLRFQIRSSYDERKKMSTNKMQIAII